MPIEKSQEYVADTNARRLLNRMHRDTTDLGKAIEALLTAAQSMRLALGNVTLSLAEVEAMHVRQSHEKRINDASLYETQAQLADLLEKARVQSAQAGDVIVGQVDKVGNLVTQAKRIAEKDVVDNEPMGPLPGMEYVDADFIAGQLGVTNRNVRLMVESGRFPAPDAVDGEGGRSRQMWLKHVAVVAIHNAKKRKKGIAAII